MQRGFSATAVLVALQPPILPRENTVKGSVLLQMARDLPIAQPPRHPEVP